jgi:hypothetical protein
MAGLQQLFLERIARERAELREPWRELREDFGDGWSDADLKSMARAELADDASLLRRAREHQRDPWMRAQCKAWHVREIARLERTAGTAVPGSSAYPRSVPDGYWPEISR